MKTNLIRVLAIATLASSLSAFAATNEAKHGSAANAPATTQAGCTDNAKESKTHKKSAKPQTNDQDEKELDRLLMGIYG
jgi:hypothetical protein